jgi:hypothetical protein
MKIPVVIAVLVVAAWMTVSPSLAAETPCNVSGVYVGSAAADAPQGIRQSIFTLTFQPPADCTPGASGLVNVEAKLLQKGNHAPEFFSGQVPYTVNNDTLTLALGGSIAAEGLLAFGPCGVADTIVFVASAGSDPSVRFSGVAHSKTPPPCP